MADVVAVLGPLIGGFLVVWWTQRKTSQRQLVEDLQEERTIARERLTVVEKEISQLQVVVSALRAQETLWRVIYSQQNIEIERLGGVPVPLPPTLATPTA